jgi:hypothetical protein
VGLVVGQQAAVGAAVRPSRVALARPAGVGHPLPPALFDDRQFLADHAHVGGLPCDLIVCGPQLGTLAIQAVLDLIRRAGQVGEHEFQLAELGADRPDHGEYLALQLFVARLDRGAEEGAARVDLAQDHRDVGSYLVRPLVTYGQDVLHAPVDVPLEVAA